MMSFTSNLVSVRISFPLQRQIQKNQVYGGKSTVRGAVSGTASTIAFTPLQVRKLHFTV